MAATYFALPAKNRRRKVSRYCHRATFEQIDGNKPRLGFDVAAKYNFGEATLKIVGCSCAMARFCRKW
jgi:hypothetical protein